MEVLGFREGVCQSLSCSNRKRAIWWRALASCHPVPKAVFQEPKGLFILQWQESVKSGLRNTTGPRHIDHTSNFLGRRLEYVRTSTPWKSKKAPGSLLAASWKRITPLYQIHRKCTFFSLDPVHSGSYQALWDWPQMETGSSWSCKRRFRQGR